MKQVSKVDKKNGEILLGFRKQNKMTQTELGNVVGKDKRDVSKWEKGYITIPQSIIETLNKKYRLKLSNTGKLMKSEKSVATSTVKEFEVKGSTFGKRLFSLRTFLNLTQAAFAKKFKFEPSRLSRLESNKTSNISVKSLKALNKAGYISDLIK